MTSPEAANYLLNFADDADIGMAAIFMKDKITENTLGPATAEQSPETQKEALEDPLATVLRDEAHLVIPSTNGAKIVKTDQIEHYFRTFQNEYLGNEFTLLDAHILVEILHNAMQEVKAQVPGGYVPLLHSIKEESNGHDITITYMSLEDPTKTIQIKTQNQEFLRAKTILEDKEPILSKSFSYTNGEFIPHSKAEVQPVNTLNAAFFIMALGDIVKSETYGGKNSTLSTAVNIQMWMNFAGAGLSTGQDIAGIIKLLREAIGSGQLAAIKSTSKGISGVFFRTASVLSECLGVVINAANVLFDIYELNHTDTAAEKYVTGTRLVFDSGALGVAGGAGLAAAAGFSTAAAFLGSIAVPVAGIGIGVSALASNFAHIAEDASKIGKYFWLMDKSFQSSYKLNQTSNVLEPESVAVIKEVNFKTGKVELDSPMLMRSKHGRTGSGKINYFFWAGDFPEVDHSRPPFDIRERLGYPSTQPLPRESTPSTPLILPIASKSTIVSYQWNVLPFATARSDDGFNLLRKLEEQYDFDFDFYIFPFEQIIQKMDTQFEDTTVKVILDNQQRTLVMPGHTGETANKLNYEIIGAGGYATLYLRKDARVTLKDETSTDFIFDLSFVQTDSIAKTGDIKFRIGEVDVENHLTESKLYVRTKQWVKQIDLNTGNAEIVHVNGSGFENEQQLNTFLNHQVHSDASHFWRVSNVNGKVVTYDPNTYIYIYTEPKITENEIVLFVTGKEAWFTSSEEELWSIDVDSHKVRNRAQLVGVAYKEQREVVSIKKINDTLIVEERIQNMHGQNSNTHLRYLLWNGSFSLVSVSIDYKTQPEKLPQLKDIVTQLQDTVDTIYFIPQIPVENYKNISWSLGG